MIGGSLSGKLSAIPSFEYYSTEETEFCDAKPEGGIASVRTEVSFQCTMFILTGGTRDTNGSCVRHDGHNSVSC